MNGTKRAYEETSQNDGKNESKKAARPSFKLRQLCVDEKRRTNDEVHSSIVLCPVTVAIMDTPQFQRLRGIKQMGTSEHVYMNCNHNRFEHSVGVSHLAEKMCRTIQERQPLLECTDKDVLCVKLAGLLHDVGHGPFSHLYEQFLCRVFPSYLKENPDIEALRNKEYPDLKVDLENWCHEEISLKMIDAILEHIG